jgi:hypothetical protein
VKEKNGPNFPEFFIWQMGDRQISTSVSSKQAKYKRVS